MDAKESIERDFQRQIRYNHVEEYHELGYKGKGITILNAESLHSKDGHGEMTTGVINDYAPEVFILNSQIKGSGENRFIEVNGKYIELEEAIKQYNIKLVTSSISVAGDKTTLNYYKELQQKYGLIFFCAAGNYADDGISSGWAKDNTAITVGAVRIKETGTIERMYYSSTGEELDFMSFMAKGNGTSAASPTLASKVALLLQRYGDFTQEECVEILKSISINLGDNLKFGYGLPVLPLTDKLEILEKLRGADEMPDTPETPITTKFSDVNESDWFQDEVEKAVNEGLIQGYEDGTFKPNNSITRAETAVIANRILEKVRKELKF